MIGPCTSLVFIQRLQFGWVYCDEPT